MKITREQALHGAKVFSDYFDRFDGIADYIREQKLNALSDIPIGLPGMEPETDLFNDSDMHPEDMEIEVKELQQNLWNNYLSIISSHSNMTSIPGKQLRLGVLEKNTNKWLGFIRIGSPVINMKPRNQLLNSIFTESPEKAKAFNNTTVMGFAIVPTQPFGFNALGGKLLAAICCSHHVREMMNKKYKGMNVCLFETTSLYGSSKSSSQYDGMKPYIRFKGLTDSNFLPLMHGKPYDDLKEYMENAVGEPLVPEDASSRKLKISTKIQALIKAALDKSDLDKFNQTINKALNLTEKKRYYASSYGFSNFVDVVTGKTDKLVPDKDNHHKHYLKNVINWWKKKATNRYVSLKRDNRIRKELEVWTGEKEIDIIR